MVINPTLTIPGSFLGKNDDYYYKQIKTLRWPEAPGGGPFTLRMSVHCGFIPKDSKNKEMAKDFRPLPPPAGEHRSVCKSLQRRLLPGVKGFLQRPVLRLRGPAPLGGLQELHRKPHPPLRKRDQPEIHPGPDGKPGRPSVRACPLGQLDGRQGNRRDDHPYETAGDRLIPTDDQHCFRPTPFGRPGPR